MESPPSARSSFTMFGRVAEVAERRDRVDWPHPKAVVPNRPPFWWVPLVGNDLNLASEKGKATIQLVANGNEPIGIKFRMIEGIGVIEWIRRELPPGVV